MKFSIGQREFIAAYGELPANDREKFCTTGELSVACGMGKQTDLWEDIGYMIAYAEAEHFIPEQSLEPDYSTGRTLFLREQVNEVIEGLRKARIAWQEYKQSEEVHTDEN